MNDSKSVSNVKSTWMRWALLPVLMALSLAPKAGATVISYESFASYTAGTLPGQTYKATGYASGGSWSGGTAQVSTSGGLSFSSGGVALPVSGGKVTYTATDTIATFDTSAGGAFSSYVASGVIGGGATSGTLYYSFLYQKNATIGGNYGGLELYNGGNEVLGIPTRTINPNTFSYFPKNTGDLKNNLGSGTTLVQDANVHLFVVRFDFVANGNDTVKIWMDPDLSKAENNQNSSTTYYAVMTGDYGFSNFHIRGSYSFFVDEIRFATSWAEAVQSVSVWNNASGGSWNTAGNWTPAGVVTGVNTPADFSTLDISGNVGVTLDGSFAVGSLSFGDTTGADGNWILSPGTGGTLTIGGAVAVPSQTATLGVILAGTSGLTKSGSGTLILTNANTFTGGCTVGGGTLQLGAGGALNSANLLAINAGAFDLNAHTQTVTMLSGAAGMLSNSAASDAALTVNIGATSAGSFAGPIATPSTGKLNVFINTTAGAAAANPSCISFNNAANTFKGSITVAGTGYNDGVDYHGVFGINGDGALGDAANSITLTNGGVLCNMYSPNAAGGWPSHAAYTLGAGRTINLAGTLGGVVRIGYNDSCTINSLIAGTGGLAHTDGGTLTLNAANTFSGDLVNRAGTTTLGHSLALQNSTLDHNNYGGGISFGSLTTATLGGLKGAQGLALPANFVLVVGNNGQSTVYSGALSGAGSSLTKTGAGAQELGGANTYSGATLVANGALRITGSMTGGGTVTVNDGASLGIKAVSSGSTLANAASLSFGTSGNTTLNLTNYSGNAIAPITATNVTANGTVTINIAGGAPLGQFPLIKYYGALVGFPNFSLGTLPRGMTATLVNNTGNQSVDLLVSSGVLWSGAFNGVWDINSTTNWLVAGLPGIYLEGDSVVFDDSASGTTVTPASTVNPVAVFFNNTNKTYTLNGSFGIAGSSGLTKSAAGTLVLANNNTFTGTVQMNAGTIQLGVSGALNGAATLSMTNGLFDLNGYSQAFSLLNGAAGTINNSAAGDATLTLNLGSTKAGNFAGLLTSSGGGKLNFSFNPTVGAGAGNASSFSLNNVGNTFKGTVTINGTGFNDGLDQHGVMGINGDGALGDPSNLLLLTNGGALCNMYNPGAGGGWPNHAAFTLGAGRTITLAGTLGGTIRLGWNDTCTINSLIAGTGGLAKTDNGNLFLANTNTFAGDTKILGGTLTLANTRALQNSTLDYTNYGGVVSFGTLTSVTLGGLKGTNNLALSANLALSVGNNNQTNIYSGVLSGTGSSLNKIGTGLFLLANTNTYTDNTLVTAGTLALGAGASISNSPTISVGSNGVFDVSLVNGGFNLTANQTLAGFGTVLGTVAANANSVLLPGASLVPGTLTVSNLTLNTGSKANFDLVAVTTAGGGINDLINVTSNLVINGSAVITIYPSPTLTAGTYRLFNYGTLAGSISSLSVTSSVPGARYTFTLDASVPNQINLIVGGVLSGSLVWQGLPTADWNLLGSISNWFNGTGVDVFFNYDPVLFDDTRVSIAAVNLTTNLQPGSVVVNTTNSYTLSGLGGIAGSAGLTKSGNGTLVVATTNTYTGTTLVSGGTLLITGALTGRGAVTLNDGTVLGVQPASGRSIISNAASLTLSSGGNTTLSFTNYSGNATAPITASNVNANGSVTINIAGAAPVGQFPLIKYYGTLTGYPNLSLGTLPRGMSANLVNNTGNQSVDLQVTLNGVTWSGASSGAWDINTTTNWIINAQGAIYLEGDKVVFDDSASGTTTVTPAAVINPGTVLFNNTNKTYTLSGLFGIAGNIGLTKSGAGTVVLANSNTFTGPVQINAGTIQLGMSGALNSAASLVMTNGVFDLNGWNQAFSMLSGTAGTINNSATADSILTWNIGVTNAANLGIPLTTTGAGSLNLVINTSLSGGTSNSAVALTNTANTFRGSLTIAGTGYSDGLDQHGLVGIVGDAVLGNATNSIILTNGGVLCNMWNPGPGGGWTGHAGYTLGAGRTIILAGTVSADFRVGYVDTCTINSTITGTAGLNHTDGGTLVLGGVNTFSGDTKVTAGTTTLGNSLAMQNSTLDYNNYGGGVGFGSLTAATLGGLKGAQGLALPNNFVLAVGNNNQTSTYSGALSGSGSSLNKIGSGNLILSGANIYTGPTIVSNGLLAVNGSLVAASAVSVATNALLGGAGTINGPVTVQAGGTLQAGLGGTNTSTLTINNTLSLAGTTAFVLNRTNAQNSSRVAGLTTVTYGGTLTVTNVGPALQGGDTFTLFTAGSRNGFFSVSNLPPLDTGLCWVTDDNFATIRVALPPVIGTQPQDLVVTQWQAAAFSVTLSGGTMPFSYQWYFSNAVTSPNFMSLPNANSATLTIPIVDMTNAGAYYVVVTNADGSATSTVATLTVTFDDMGPNIVSVGSLNGWDAGIVFDKPINPASASIAKFTVTVGGTKYYLNNPAVLRPDGRSVLLAVDHDSNPGPLSSFHVLGEWIYNLDNTFPTEETAADGGVLNPALLNRDIGTVGVDPLYAGSAFVGSSDNLIEVLAGGSDIGSTNDGMHLVYESVTNDFVATVRVASLLPSALSAKAGLMARPSLSANSQNIGVFTTPAVAEGGMGVCLATARPTNGADTVELSRAAQFSYPSNWLRLRRSGNTFYTFYSSNGVDWIGLATNTPSSAYPEAVLIGLATSAHTNVAGLFTKADYAGFEVKSGAVVVVPETGLTSLVATQNVARIWSTAELLANDYDPKGESLSIAAVSGIQPVTFTTDFSSGLPAGTALYRGATNTDAGILVTNGSNVYLQLTPAVVWQNGTFLISNLTPGRAVAAFSASFKARVGDGNADAADGFSFNLASDLPDGISGSAEDGVGSGLGICFDNYPAAGPGAPSVKIRWGNALIATNLIQKMTNSNWFTVQINLAADGKLDVAVDGTNVFSRFQTPYQPLSGRFGLYARTGGSYETHWIDDLSITAYTLHTVAGGTSLGGTVTLTNSTVYYNPPTNACGTDTFYYLVADAVGHTTLDSATVVLKDVTPPVLSYPASVVTNTTGPCGQTVNYTVTATDNCDGSRTVICSPSSGPFPLGPTTVTCVASDTNLNTNTCSFTVTVVDTTPPAITCPGNRVAYTAGASATVSFTTTATDNCDVSPVVNCTPGSGSSFPVGTNTVTCEAHDVSLNTNTCTFTVIVEQVLPMPVTGSVALEAFVGVARVVEFKATDENGVVLATRTLPLNFSEGTASYSLDNVPVATKNLSAKTAWNLRQKVQVVFGGGAAVANFTDTAMLPAGDLNNDNSVTIDDYYLLAALWYTSNPAADLDGNGRVDLDDYFLLANRWLLTGQAP